MMNAQRTSNFSFKTISDLSPLSSQVQTHLKNVYLTLATLVGISAVGVYFQIITHFSVTLSTFLSFALILYLIFFTNEFDSPTKVLFDNTFVY